MSEAGERSKPSPEGRVAERLSAADKKGEHRPRTVGGRGMSELAVKRQA
jgi:hypothetical protein